MWSTNHFGLWILFLMLRKLTNIDKTSARTTWIIIYNNLILVSYISCSVFKGLCHLLPVVPIPSQFFSVNSSFHRIFTYIVLVFPVGFLPLNIRCRTGFYCFPSRITSPFTIFLHPSCNYRLCWSHKVKRLSDIRTK